MERRSVLRPVTGAITCAAAGNLASPAFSKAATHPCSSSAGRRNSDELGQPVTGLAKPHELRAACSGPREEVLRW
jgi:hypothetical protein